MATIVRKDDRITIPDEEIVAVTATIQLNKPVIRVICKDFDYYGRELILRRRSQRNI